MTPSVLGLLAGRSKQFSSTNLLVPLILMIALSVMVLAGLQSARGQTSRSSIVAANLVSENSGWALTPQALHWTSDAGSSWRAITPTDVDPISIRGLYFIDENDGWLVSSGETNRNGETPIYVYRTEDSGSSWNRLILDTASAAYTASYSGPASVFFLDSQFGWIVVKLPSSANFSRGILFRTIDGGSTWSTLEIPTGDPVYFVTPEVGWNAGGPGNKDLYVTQDGGQTWSQQGLTPPSAYKSSQINYSLPTFTSRQDGVLPVTFAGSSVGSSGVGFYVTNDGGESWEISLTIPSPNILERGVQIPTEITDTDRWIAAFPGNRPIRSTNNRGNTVQVVDPAGLPPGYRPPMFVTDSLGWMHAIAASCADEKTDCSIESSLFQSSDGGESWTEIGP